MRLEFSRQLDSINWKKTKYYQAGTSELYGRNEKTPQNERTNFHPASPYGVAKLYAHWITINYKEAYKIFACNGILFNHESPRRGETLLRKKLFKLYVESREGSKEHYILVIYMPKEIGVMQETMLRQCGLCYNKKPVDLVISTGKQSTVKNFVNKVSRKLNMRIT